MLVNIYPENYSVHVQAQLQLHHFLLRKQTIEQTNKQNKEINHIPDLRPSVDVTYIYRKSMT